MTTIRYQVEPEGDRYALWSIVDTPEFAGVTRNWICGGTHNYCTSVLMSLQGTESMAVKHSAGGYITRQFVIDITSEHSYTDPT